MDAAVNNFVSRKVVSAVGKTVHVEASGISDTSRLADDLAIGRFGRLKLGIYLEEIFRPRTAGRCARGFLNRGGHRSLYQPSLFQECRVVGRGDGLGRNLGRPGSRGGPRSPFEGPLHRRSPEPSGSLATEIGDLPSGDRRDDARLRLVEQHEVRRAVRTPAARDPGGRRRRRGAPQ